MRALSDLSFETLPCDAMTIVISVILARRLLSATHLFTTNGRIQALPQHLTLNQPERERERESEQTVSRFYFCNETKHFIMDSE